MNNITIHQPNVFPRLKVLQKIYFSKSWIILDDVQYVNREWQNRVKFRNFTNPSQDFWITIPLSKYSRLSTKYTIKDQRILNFLKTKEKIMRQIYEAYRKSPYLEWIMEYISTVFDEENDNLSIFAVKSITTCFEMLNVNINYTISSLLKIESHRNEKLIGLCKKVNASHYTTGSGGLSYLNNELFKQNKLTVIVQNWCPPATDIYNEKLEWKNFSFLDYIARYGPEKLLEHLQNGIYRYY